MLYVGVRFSVLCILLSVVQEIVLIAADCIECSTTDRSDSGRLY